MTQEELASNNQHFTGADVSMVLFMDCHDGANVVDCEMPLRVGYYTTIIRLVA